MDFKTWLNKMLTVSFPILNLEMLTSYYQNKIQLIFHSNQFDEAQNSVPLHRKLCTQPDGGSLAQTLRW